MSPVNGGFSAGNNLGMQRCEASLYLLMNSDTYPRPGAIAELLRAAEANPDYGMLGPRLEDEDGSVQVSAFRFHTPLSEVDQAIAVAPLSRLLSPRAVRTGIPSIFQSHTVVEHTEVSRGPTLPPFHHHGSL